MTQESALDQVLRQTREDYAQALRDYETSRQVLQQTRERYYAAFEAWRAANPPPYVSVNTRAAFEAWQAASALSDDTLRGR
jgi:hypothetical protein